MEATFRRMARATDPATTGAACTADGSKCDYLTASSIAKIRSISKHALDKVAPAPTGGATAGRGFSC